MVPIAFFCILATAFDLVHSVRLNSLANQQNALTVTSGNKQLQGVAYEINNDTFDCFIEYINSDERQSSEICTACVYHCGVPQWQWWINNYCYNNECEVHARKYVDAYNLKQAAVDRTNDLLAQLKERSEAVQVVSAEVSLSEYRFKEREKAGLSVIGLGSILKEYAVTRGYIKFQIDQLSEDIDHQHSEIASADATKTSERNSVQYYFNLSRGGLGTCDMSGAACKMTEHVVATGKSAIREVEKFIEREQCWFWMGALYGSAIASDFEFPALAVEEGREAYCVGIIGAGRESWNIWRQTDNLPLAADNFFSWATIRSFYSVVNGFNDFLSKYVCVVIDHILSGTRRVLQHSIFEKKAFSQVCSAFMKNQVGPIANLWMYYAMFACGAFTWLGIQMVLEMLCLFVKGSDGVYCGDKLGGSICPLAKIFLHIKDFIVNGQAIPDSMYLSGFDYDDWQRSLNN